MLSHKLFKTVNELKKKMLKNALLFITNGRKLTDLLYNPYY